MSTKPSGKLTEGQSVRVIPAAEGSQTRPAPYYDFYEGLTGTVAKVYPDATVAVAMDRASLPDDVRRRHEANEQAENEKWLRGLSEENRSKLTEKQKHFSLRYTLLISAQDIAPADGKPAAKKTPAPAKVVETEATRKSSADLDAEEQRHLDELLGRTQQG